jgi:diaminopimelate epimerase
MKLSFSKYHGAGNDFILFDNRMKEISLTTEQIALLCHRHYGIGADGLMLLESEQGYDFRMVYYNSDGKESSMCGNGGRCIAAFAQKLGVVKKNASFIATDGPHQATIENGMISLQMQDVNGIKEFDTHHILNTGSPHYITWVDDIHITDVFTKGRAIRSKPEFQPGGINVNFVQCVSDGLWVRTYERGVENETHSCGTGVTAAAIAASGHSVGDYSTTIYTTGGTLHVTFTKDSPNTAKNVILKGPALLVFEGTISL